MPQHKRYIIDRSLSILNSKRRLTNQQLHRFNKTFTPTCHPSPLQDLKQGLLANDNPKLVVNKDKSEVGSPTRLNLLGCLITTVNGGCRYRRANGLNFLKTTGGVWMLNCTHYGVRGQ